MRDALTGYRQPPSPMPLDEQYADCISIMSDMECAMNLIDALAYDDNDMGEAYSLMEKAYALVQKKLAALEVGE